MRFLSAALGAWLCLVTATALPADFYSVFTHSSNNWHASTTIEFPNSTAFVNATERWNSFDAPTYSVAVTPASEADVATAVKIARSINLPFLGTGGRHSSSVTLGNLHQGLAIDLSMLNNVNVNAKAGTLTIGGGTRFGHMIDPVYEAGFQMPIGSCSCPGMVGATIGAGVGRYQGVNGLIIDSVLSVRLVTAEGKLIDVSEVSNPDLYWAIRGAGANFGIITSATYQLHPQINNGQVLNADFIFPASSNDSYFDILQSLQDNMPAELATITFMEYNATVGEAQILSNWVYIGPEDKGRELIAPLFDLNPNATSVSMVAYKNLTNTAAFGLGVPICEPVYIKGYGANYRNLSSSTYQTVFQKLSDFYADYPDGRDSSVEIEIFAPQAVEAVASDATAYPWRDSRGYAGISFGFNTTETQQAGDVVANEIRSAFAATSGYDGLAVYVSYGHGDESLEQVYGSNLPRLTQLKSKWDPDDVFRFFHDLSA